VTAPTEDFHATLGGVAILGAWVAAPAMATAMTGVGRAAAASARRLALAAIAAARACINGTADPEEGPSSRILNFTGRALQKGFDKHGSDLGLSGNWNPGRAAEYSRAIHEFINSPEVIALEGTYRGSPVIHYFNPATGVNVISTPSGGYVTAFSLGVEQLQALLNTGAIQ
jgi:hypothetical protein